MERDLKENSRMEKSKDLELYIPRLALSSTKEIIIMMSSTDKEPSTMKTLNHLMSHLTLRILINLETIGKSTKEISKKEKSKELELCTC